MSVLFSSPKFPQVPEPRTPPPPAQTLPPPARTGRPIQEAEKEARELFRRRGRKTTLMTPGGGAGVTDGVAPAQKVLLGT